LGGANGLAPSVQNYALGFSVTFPVMDFKSIQAREAAQAATVAINNARLAVDYDSVSHTFAVSERMPTRLHDPVGGGLSHCGHRYR